jgi:catechol 2,3-dioxygenase-like lactoylglutathione lyase family enzyme
MAMINGVHALFFSPDAKAMRAFLRDKLDLASVDAGGGWLIFALPPAELGVHPSEAGDAHQELYFMCDDIEATVERLKAKGVEFDGPITDARFGRVATLLTPDGQRLALYQPSHPTALGKDTVDPS